MVEEVSIYVADVERAQSGWSIHVPEVDRHTWAPNLREVPDMARDLVQVMTDQPLEEIAVDIRLPENLSAPIRNLRAAQSAATDAEAAAREAQRLAAETLRNAGAPLRDIAETLGISHQRVHQVLADVTRRREQLAQFRLDVTALLESELDVPLVTDDDGRHPIAVVLGDELLTTLIERTATCGGYASVFVQSLNGAIRFVAVVRDECAIAEATDDLTADGDRPGATAMVDTFVDYLTLHPQGVRLATDVDARAQDARTLAPA